MAEGESSVSSTPVFRPETKSVTTSGVVSPQDEFKGFRDTHRKMVIERGGVIGGLYSEEDGWKDVEKYSGPTFSEVRDGLMAGTDVDIGGKRYTKRELENYWKQLYDMARAIGLDTKLRGAVNDVLERAYDVDNIRKMVSAGWDETGVNKQALANHFGSKDELGTIDVGRMWRSGLEAADTKKGKAVSSKLEQIYREYPQFFRQQALDEVSYAELDAKRRVTSLTSTEEAMYSELGKKLYVLQLGNEMVHATTRARADQWARAMKNEWTPKRGGPRVDTGVDRRGVTIEPVNEFSRKPDVFDPDFLKAHHFFTDTFTEPKREPDHENDWVSRGVDTASLLQYVYENGSLPYQLSPEHVDYTANLIAGGDMRRKAVEGDRANRMWTELRYGILPLMIFRFKTKSGKFEELGGTDKGGGVLRPQGDYSDINIPNLVDCWRGDEKAKRALGMWFMLDGLSVGNTTGPDEEFVRRHKAKYDEIMKSSPKSDLNLQADVREYAQQLAKEMAVHLGSGTGRTNLMLALGTILGVRLMLVEYRKIDTEKGPYETLRSADKKELALAPLVRKIKLGDGPMSFGYVERQMRENGIDGLFNAVSRLQEGHDLYKYWMGMASIMDAMKKGKLMEEGQDSFPNIDKRLQARDELYQGLVTMEVPQITQETLTKLKKRRVARGKGKAVLAGPGDWDFGAAIRKFFG